MAKNKSKKGQKAIVHQKANVGDVALTNGSSAPKSFKSHTQDDFVLTISDSDSLPDEESDIEARSDDEPARNKPQEEEEEEQQRGKKRKRGASKGENASNKHAKREKGDGDMDSDFEFQTGDLDNDGLEDLDGWGFEGAKPAMSEGKKGVDIDAIISRRKEKKKLLEGNKATEQDEDVANGADDESEESFIGLDDDDDDGLSDVAFGGGVGSDEEENLEGSEEETSDDEEEKANEEAADSDSDSVASEVAHPDDDIESSASSSESDSERKAAFFAPESDQPATKSGTTFQQMTLSRPILRGLGHVGFSTPTAIQASTIPVALLGRDVVGGAVTGSGKTAAYMVPILERLLYRPKKVPTSRVVVLCPTRELAIQVHAVAIKLAAFTDIKFALAVGGLSLKVQEAALRLRPDVIIATPGRFIDHMRNSLSFATDAIEILVLDEADRMLDDGFADELDEILKTLPKSRQTMLFSATMTDSVDKLVRMGMQRPVRLFVDSKKTVETLTQEFVRIRQGWEDSRLAMLMMLVHDLYLSKCIIFFRSKAFAHRVRVVFGLTGLKAAELHGSLSQEQRIRAVEDFRDGKVDFLLATDLASRGLDIKNVSYVINYELPQTHEIYLHRVGRTARAGRTGRAITLAAEGDRKLVKAAVKAAEVQKSKVLSRKLDQDKVTEWTTKLSEMESEIQHVLDEEAEERQLQVAEMQVKKGENLIKYEEEIHSRPKRTFPFSEKDKSKAKAAGAALLNGMPKADPKKKSGKLSGKKKKLLLSKDDRAGDNGKVWKKTKEVRIEGTRRGAKAKDAAKARGGAVSKKTKVGKSPKGKVKGKRR